MTRMSIRIHDQPPSFKLDYLGMNGRRLVVFHTPDYFRDSSQTAGWEECKTEEELEKLAAKNPNRYCRERKMERGDAARRGVRRAVHLYYRVRTSKSIDWIFQRNIQFIEDYLRTDLQTSDKAAR